MRGPTVDRERRSLLTGRLDEIRRAEIHVVSLVVYADPSRVSEISDAVGRLPGVEVHANDGHGKLVVVLETAGDADMAAAIDRVRYLRGTSRPAAREGRTALDILDERFARGEIDKDDYEERKRTLSD